MNKSNCLPGEKSARFGVFLLIAIFPVFLTKVYQNITVSRYFFFTLTASFCFMLCMLAWVRKADVIDSVRSLKNKELSKPDLFFMLFLLVAVVSTLSSKYRLASLGGGGGRRMGLLLIIATFLSYIFISKFYRIRKKEFIFFGITVAFSSIFGFIQFLGFDPFNMLSGLKSFDFYRFISFSGNINIHASFICIGASFAMYMFCFAEKKRDLFFWLAVAVCGFTGLLTSNSDSGYLGVLVAFLALAVLSSKERKRFIRFFVTVVAFLITCGLFGAVHGQFDNARGITFIGRILINPVFVAVSVAVTLLVLFYIYEKVFDEEQYSFIHDLIVLLICLTVVAALSLIFYFTFIDTETDIGSLEHYLRFDDSWGTDRGYVWKRMISVFNSFPFYRKFIGSGPDTAVFELMIQYGEEMRHELFYYFDNAHNDLIQYLVTLGIWGVVTYLGLVFGAIQKGLRSESVYSRAAVLAVISFFAQSAVNIYQPITTPLFFVFIALSQCSEYGKDK